MVNIIAISTKHKLLVHIIMGNKKSRGEIFNNLDGKCLFPTHVSLWTKPDWEDMPDYFRRINKIEDDRSYIILMSSILELRIEKFLHSVFPNSNMILNERTSFARKIELVKAFNYIPTQFIEIADLLRQIRNDFAHNYEIDSLEEAGQVKKMPQRLKLMNDIWHEYEPEMPYWKSGRPLRFQYKDLWRICIEGFKMFELNVKLLRREVENEDFIKKLMDKSEDLYEQRKTEEKDRAWEIVLKRDK